MNDTILTTLEEYLTRYYSRHIDKHRITITRHDIPGHLKISSPDTGWTARIHKDPGSILIHYGLYYPSNVAIFQLADPDFLDKFTTKLQTIFPCPKFYKPPTTT